MSSQTSLNYYCVLKAEQPSITTTTRRRRHHHCPRVVGITIVVAVIVVVAVVVDSTAATAAIYLAPRHTSDTHQTLPSPRFIESYHPGQSIRLPRSHVAGRQSRRLHYVSQAAGSSFRFQVIHPQETGRSSRLQTCGPDRIVSSIRPRTVPRVW